MNDIATLEQAHHALELLGYECRLHDQSIAIKVGGVDHAFPAVLTLNANANQFQISCMIAKLGEIGDRNLIKFAIAALDANSRIAPFAYALLTDSDDPKMNNEEEWTVVLTHSIPVGDFSIDELETAMTSLLMALMDSSHVIPVINDKVKV